ncbi:hypothetical protein NLU13_4059 [Sarocladium strictum]|uniref:Uncharacterized protein n=1 Tax=Sarocladium strictum TaxID=5046 RepID=A0AA39L8K2_SARSR|nr:hypothetical protein NLU13_4059 [Sarocladium strictum]
MVSRIRSSTAMGKQAEDQVRGWGFRRVFEWTDPPNTHYPPHKHAGLTTHLLLRGELTICYPEEQDGEKQTFKAGERVDVDKGRVHEVWIGKEGCTMVIGE